MVEKTLYERLKDNGKPHFPKSQAFNWRKSDGNRAATLREAKTAQELAKMGQMALQMAEALRPQ